MYNAAQRFFVLLFQIGFLEVSKSCHSSCRPIWICVICNNSFKLSCFMHFLRLTPLFPDSILMYLHWSDPSLRSVFGSKWSEPHEGTAGCRPLAPLSWGRAVCSVWLVLLCTAFYKRECWPTSPLPLPPLLASGLG